MKNQTLLSFLFFTCFLVIGYMASSNLYHSNYDSLSNSVSLTTIRNSNSIQSMNNGQRSILLIGVDSFDTSQSHLASLWLVTYLPSDSNLRMFPISPSGKDITSKFEERLNRSFNLNRNNGEQVLGQEFIKVLEENNYWWSGYFIFDEIALTKMTNLLGGVENNEEIIFNNQNQKLSGGTDDSQNVFISQLAIIQTACHQLAGLKQNPDWSPITSLIPTHVLTDLDMHQFLMEWETLLSSGQKPNCRFPTLEISWINN